MSMTFDQRMDTIEQTLVDLTNLAQKIPTLDEEDAVIRDDIFTDLQSFRDRLSVLESMVEQTYNSLVRVAKDRGVLPESYNEPLRS